MDKSRNILLSCRDIWFGYVPEHIVLKGIFMDIHRENSSVYWEVMEPAKQPCYRYWLADET